MFIKWWLSLERCLVLNLIRLFRIRAHSEKVARGFALGFIVNFFPTFGFGFVISTALARILGGNAIAGFVGGITLTFFWPLLFYMNLRTGTLFVAPPLIIDDLDDVNKKTMNALVWGKTFVFGLVVNCVLAGVTVYVVLRLVYDQMRPFVLRYLRQHAREHQRRFRRPSHNPA